MTNQSHVEVTLSGAVRSIMILNSAQVLKRTLNVLLLFFMCDIFNILSGVSFLCYGTWKVLEPVEKSAWISFGKYMVILGLMSGMCNFLTRFGIRIWSRSFLVPYIVFLVMLLTYVLIQFTQSVSLRGVKEVDSFSLLATLVILYIWQIMVRQWIYMSLPRPVMHDPETPVTLPALPSEESSQSAQMNSPPPKYDSLEDTIELPNYEEAVGGVDYTTNE